MFQSYLNKKFKGSYIKTSNEFPQQHEEFQYLDIIRDLIKNGKEKNDRTGTGILGSFGRMMRFDLSESFPLLTTKKVFWRGVAEELIWFIRGQTNGNLVSK